MHMLWLYRCANGTDVSRLLKKGKKLDGVSSLWPNEATSLIYTVIMAHFSPFVKAKMLNGNGFD